MAPAPVFTHETFRFFRELRRNNCKPWMDANRDRYRLCVVEPFRQLLAELAPVALRLSPDFDTSGRTGTNFSRINRDIRFAADKAPYRPQMYLMFAARRASVQDAGQLYVGVAASVVTVGFRIYGGGRASPLAQLARPRAIAHRAWLVRQARRLGRGYESYWYATQGGEWTKHDGWPLAPEQWKRLKGWIVRRRLKPRDAVAPGFPRVVGAAFREVFPLYPFTSALTWRP